MLVMHNVLYCCILLGIKLLLCRRCQTAMAMAMAAAVAAAAAAAAAAAVVAAAAAARDTKIQQKALN